MLLENICRTLDTVEEHDIPVYRGAHEALVTSYKNNCGYHGKRWIQWCRLDSEPDYSKSKGRICLGCTEWKWVKYPNKINLIAVGPLTNVALAMKLDPDLSRLKNLYIMRKILRHMAIHQKQHWIQFLCWSRGCQCCLKAYQVSNLHSFLGTCFKYVKISWIGEIRIWNLNKPASNLIDNWIGLVQRLYLLNTGCLWSASYGSCPFILNNYSRNLYHHAQVELSGTVTEEWWFGPETCACQTKQCYHHRRSRDIDIT